MELNDSKTIIALATFVGSILGALGITKWQLSSHNNRISNLEITTVKTSSCDKLRDLCPIHAYEESFKDLKRTIQEEFSKHNKLHLNLATEIGRLQGRCENSKEENKK